MAIDLPVKTLVDFTAALASFNVTIDGAQRPGTISAHAWLRNGTADERYVNTVIKFDYINNLVSVFVVVNKNSKFDYIREKLDDSVLFTKVDTDTYAVTGENETSHSTGRLDDMYEQVVNTLDRTLKALATILY